MKNYVDLVNNEFFIWPWWLRVLTDVPDIVPITLSMARLDWNSGFALEKYNCWHCARKFPFLLVLLFLRNVFLLRFDHLGTGDDVKRGYANEFKIWSCQILKLKKYHTSNMLVWRYIVFGLVGPQALLTQFSIMP